MAKRLTDTDIWDKEWFMKLPPKLKCAVKFIHDKCDLAGVWCPNWDLAKMYVGEKLSETEVLSIDLGRQFVKLPTGKIFCPEFINFQNGKLSDRSPIHIKIIGLLENHNIPYPYPINGVCNTPIVEVEVKEEVKVKVGVVVKSEFNLNFIDPELLPTYLNFLQMRSSIKKPFKSQLSIEANYKQLLKISNQNIGHAKEIIEQSIANQWQGFFEIKNNTYGTSKNKQPDFKPGGPGKL